MNPADFVAADHDWLGRIDASGSGNQWRQRDKTTNLQPLQSKGGVQQTGIPSLMGCAKMRRPSGEQRGINKCVTFVLPLVMGVRDAHHWTEKTSLRDLLGNRVRFVLCAVMGVRDAHQESMDCLTIKSEIISVSVDDGGSLGLTNEEDARISEAAPETKFDQNETKLTVP
ncbi:hypothetical protein B0H19DRAFT_1086231 [Mycena capillaripes]|nr:hypothetical protein B0H19DRAFT_1086231 [Mycena capillaripes]